MSTGIGAGIAGQVFQTNAGLGRSGPITCPTNFSCSYDGATEWQQSATTPLLGTGNFTISFWIKTPDPTGGGNNQRIIGHFGGGTTQWTIYLVGSGSGAGRFQWVSTGSGFWNDNYQGFNPASNTWYHIVYSVDRSGDAIWYYNGANANAFDVSSKTINLDADGTFYIGRNPTGQYLNGNLTEISMWDKALTAAEVLELYNNMAGDKKCLGDLTMGANLTNWWRMFNPSGTYIDPIPNAASGGTITLNNQNMDATNVSTDVP